MAKKPDTTKSDISQSVEGPGPTGASASGSATPAKNKATASSSGGSQPTTDKPGPAPDDKNVPIDPEHPDPNVKQPDYKAGWVHPKDDQGNDLPDHQLSAAEQKMKELTGGGGAHPSFSTEITERVPKDPITDPDLIQDAADAANADAEEAKGDTSKVIK